MIKFQIFPVDQPGGTFYYAKLPREGIVNKLEIRRRSAQADGVQRDLDLKRIKEISAYLSMADAIIPTPLVISVKNADIEVEGDIQYIKVYPSEDGVWGEIIDGQHRYEGLRKTDNFDNYEVPLCIFIDLKIEDKATVFSTINSTQVKVPKSYIYDLFDYTDSNTPAKFCHDVCKTLNYEPNGPLHKRIKMLGRKLNNSEVLSQAALVDAIIPLISKNEKHDDKAARNNAVLLGDENLPLRQLYISADVPVFSKIFSNYLRALKKCAEDNWENFVLKSIGIKVFARLLAFVVVQGLQKNDLSEKYFDKSLMLVKDEISKCNTSDGTNKPAEDAAVEMLVNSYISAVKKLELEQGQR